MFIMILTMSKSDKRCCMPKFCGNINIQYTVKCKRNLGFRTELLVDVVCVTCSANACVVATHATHHLPLLLKFLKNIEGKPQTNTEKREEKHKLQDKRAKAAEVKEGQIEPPTRTSTHRQNSEPMNNPH